MTKERKKFYEELERGKHVWLAGKAVGDKDSFEYSDPHEFVIGTLQGPNPCRGRTVSGLDLVNGKYLENISFNQLFPTQKAALEHDREGAKRFFDHLAEAFGFRTKGLVSVDALQKIYDEEGADPTPEERVLDFFILRARIALTNAAYGTVPEQRGALIGAADLISVIKGEVLGEFFAQKEERELSAEQKLKKIEEFLDDGDDDDGTTVVNHTAEAVLAIIRENDDDSEIGGKGWL